MPRDAAIPKQDRSVFAERRKKLLAKIDPNGIVVLEGAKLKVRNNDIHYPFRQESGFYYLTGIDEPNVYAVLVPDSKENQFIVFNKAKNPEEEKWNGPVMGQEGAVKDFGANKSFKLDEFEAKLPALLENKTCIYYPISGEPKDLDSKIAKATSSFPDSKSPEMKACNKKDINVLIDQLRIIKDENEIALMRNAIEVSECAHMQAMQDCKPGMDEMDLNASLDFVFQTQGHTKEHAYGNIVGGGEHGCTLHYKNNDSPIKDGDLVLIDASEENQKYASDITRTFPANGKFSPEQLAIYDIVLKAQTAAIEMIKPGVTWNQIAKVARDIITEGLLRLGLLKGDLKDLIHASDQNPKDNPTRKFYLHGLGHYLGLDVHDNGDYTVPFAPGMVFTVEPGIYISSYTHPDVDPRWQGIGVRIEDDILVTPTGYEVLSKHLPKEAKEIEAAMAGEVSSEMKKIGYKRLNLFNKSPTLERISEMELTRSSFKNSLRA